MVLLPIFIIALAGCWNYTEISDKAIVAGVAVDYDKESDGVILTVEIAVPKTEKGENTIESSIISGKGEDFFDTARSMVPISGNKLFWSHAKILILSKDIFENKDKLIGVVDWIKRDAETRDDIWVLLSEEETAANIFYDSDIKLEKIISYHLDDILKNEKSVSKFKAVPFWKFSDELASEGISVSLPSVSIDTSQEYNTPMVLGTAVFRGLKYVGWLDGNETKSLLLTTDSLKGGLLIVENTELDKASSISLEIFSNKTKITPSFDSKEITMDISIKISVVNLAEINGTFDFMENSNLKKLEKESESIVKNQVADLIHKLQTQYESDIFGFGKIIEKENPKLWKALKQNWNSEFSNVKTNIEVDMNIRGSALRSEPVKVNR